MKSKVVKVSAIVTNYNGWDLGLVPDFLENFLKSDYKDFELFFVDNASTDDSVEMVKKRFGNDERLIIIQNPKNIMSKGINMALQQAKGEYILFLNNDIYFAKGAIDKMVDFLEKNSDVGLVQGKLVSYYDHKMIDDAGETMDLYGSPITLGAGQEDIGQFNSRQELLSATGAASLLNAHLLPKIGLLDPDYGIGYEDLDLALRIRIAGYKIFYLPDVTIFHRRGSSVSKSSAEIRTRIKYGFNKNRLATLIKNYELSTLVQALPITILIYIGSGLFEMFMKKLWGFGFSRFKALGWVVFNLPILLSKRTKVQSIRRLSDREAILPYLAKGQFLGNVKNFISSKKW